MCYDYSRNCELEIAKSILTARLRTKSARPELFTYDELCEAWNEYRHDRRFKLRVCGSTDFSGIVQVGKIRYYYQLGENTCYIREFSDNCYQNLPCFEVTITDMGYYYLFDWEYLRNYFI